MWHVWGTGEVHTGFWLGDLRETDQLEDLGIDGRTILKCILKKPVGMTYIPLDWLRIRTNGGML